ncbi:hypothetical protein I3842_10G100100 [Carya illinoinensis]|uniref:non-specific serine/threonine protein kinase n=1 Tax=Carya illinoinensis TaxID=32201 RepID=A0A922J4T0_CARIL|nr:hypothetical protein I3842_10G100100 [Carya illinoinensis]
MYGKKSVNTTSLNISLTCSSFEYKCKTNLVPQPTYKLMPNRAWLVSLSSTLSTSTSVCNWVGVTCGSKYLRVKALNLSYMGLVGIIPPCIGNLSFLVNLSTSNNKVPSWIGLLTKLQVLDLSSNKFGGTILASLSYITSLQQFSLAYNQLSGSIPFSIFNIFGLQEFSLKGNKLMAPMVNMSSLQLHGQLPSTLYKCKLLQVLSLSVNNFNGRISPKIGNLSRLTMLYLSDNNFEGSIPSDIGNLQNLEFITTSINGFVGPIPFEIFNISMIQTISMGFNKFSSHLPSYMNLFLPKLKILSLPKTKLSGRILNSISNASQLTLLDLSYNSMLLERLNLEFNNLTMESQELSLFFYSWNCKNLRIISFSSNPLHSFLPNSVGNLSLSLQRLKLASCNIKGSILVEIGNLSSLISLNLSNNKLKGLIPTTLGRLHMLQILSFRGNKLEGHILYLYLGFNQLTSTIPLSLWSLTDLLEVDLSSSSLTGILSLDIGNMKVPTLLNLSRNQLSGNIPEIIGGLIDLANSTLFSRKIPIGGLFVNFKSASFISNDALCGAPQLQVPPCKKDSPKTKRAKVSHLIKYLRRLVMLIVIPSLAYKICKTKNLGFPLQIDLYNLTTWRRISYQELLLATERFNTSNLLGEGSFGSIYKGSLSDETNIAVKVINLQVEGAFKSFDAELSIMIDVTLALEYLHYGYSSVIAHCDMKPNNILLDVEVIAHIADFGMAKLLGDEDFMMQTMTLGTLGYIAPGGVISTRGDVYSYGILLMETFTRKKPTDDMFAGEMSLKRWVNEALPISMIDIVDASLLGNERYYIASEECISLIMGLALDCCADLPKQRTNMKIVLATLKKIKAKYYIMRSDRT